MMSWHEPRLNYRTPVLRGTLVLSDNIVVMTPLLEAQSSPAEDTHGTVEATMSITQVNR